MSTIEKKIMRERDGEWCQLEVRLADGKLSICGSAGVVLTRAAAKRQALECWRSFFEDQPEERHAMNDRNGKAFRSPLSAAKHVLACDGEFHGLDVTREDGNKVYALHSCGQITDELREWFPEVIPYLPWHLNDMRAGCEHQEALGWGHGRDIALTAADLTDAQRETLDGEAAAQIKRVRAKERVKRIEQLQTSSFARGEFLRAHGQRTIDADAFVLRGMKPAYGYRLQPRDQVLSDALDAEIAAKIAAAHPPAPFRSQIFKDCLGAPCPTCGYKYGTQWLKRDLPPGVISWVDSLENS